MPPVEIVGLVGLDTSHVEHFADFFRGRLAGGFPGGSPDFPLSAERVQGFTKKLQGEHGLVLFDSPRAVAAAADAVLITSVDGRAHLGQFAEVAPLRRPVFIDKPFATTTADAQAIVALARQYDTPLFSSSSLRFAPPLREALADDRTGPVLGADFFGPTKLQPTQTGFFWYGIHLADMLYAALGSGCESVRATSTPDHDLIVGVWRDGRIGTVRGNRTGNDRFTGAIHRATASQWIPSPGPGMSELRLAEAIDAFFAGGAAPVPLEETMELIRFLEAANASAARGGERIGL